MSLPRPPRADAIRPTEQMALQAWAARVRADREQVQRCREVDDPADYYAPLASQFAQDPHRRDEPALEALLEMVGAADTWLDIGAGGGRYALPLASRARRVIAVDPSPAMLEVLRQGMRSHGIGNIEIREGHWPLEEDAWPDVDVALMAHVGYDIEAIGPFLDAAEAVARRRCVAIMREGHAGTAGPLFWRDVHGEERVVLPALPELVTLLVARGTTPEVRLSERAPSGFDSLEALRDAARQRLWLRAGSDKDRLLQRLVVARASEQDGAWFLDERPTRIGVVVWTPRRDRGSVRGQASAARAAASRAARRSSTRASPSRHRAPERAP